MDDMLRFALSSWWGDEPVGLATVVSTQGSAPRPVGATMLVLPDQTTRGSVSGGCVESDVYELVKHVMKDGRPVLKSYGFSDADAFAIGLTCGGELSVFAQRLDRRALGELESLAADTEAGRPVALATVVEHPNELIQGRRFVVRPDQSPDAPAPLISVQVDQTVLDEARKLLAAGESSILSFGPNGERHGEGIRVFVQAWAPRPRMLVFGAIDFASAVCRFGSFIGYDVTVCDARPVFATTARFPGARDVVVDWPHRYLAAEHEAGRLDERTVVVVLTHDAKFDVPLLELALRLPVAYVGAMGSRRTHSDRASRLEAAGLSEEQLGRLHSPIGLDLGARTPEETAVSIIAEIVAHRSGGSGMPLTATSGPIHTPQNQSIGA